MGGAAQRGGQSPPQGGGGAQQEQHLQGMWPGGPHRGIRHSSSSAGTPRGACALDLESPVLEQALSRWNVGSLEGGGAGLEVGGHPRNRDLGEEEGTDSPGGCGGRGLGKGHGLVHSADWQAWGPGDGRSSLRLSLSRGRKEASAEGPQEGHTSLDRGVPRQLAGVWRAGAARSAAGSRNEAGGGVGVGGNNSEGRWL